MGSRIYKELSRGEIEAIVMDTLGAGARIVTCEIAAGGFFNTSYKIETVNPERKWILRVAPIRPELLLEYEKTMMRSESVMSELLTTAGVPTASVVRFDGSHALIDRDYILIEYIESMNFSSPDFPEEHRARILRELGTYTRKIHDIKANQFGHVAPDGSAKGNHADWYSVIDSLVCEIADKAARNKLVDDREIQAFCDFYRQHKSVFVQKDPQGDDRPSLVHNDLWAPNILVRRAQSGEWEIAALIDADRAMYADREYEFVLWDPDKSFMEGYGTPLDETREGRIKRFGYSMLLTFQNAYIYKIEFADEQNFERSIANLRGKLNRDVENI